MDPTTTTTAAETTTTTVPGYPEEPGSLANPIILAAVIIGAVAFFLYRRLGRLDLPTGPMTPLQQHDYSTAKRSMWALVVVGGLLLGSGASVFLSAGQDTFSHEASLDGQVLGIALAAGGALCWVVAAYCGSKAQRMVRVASPS